MANEFYTDIDLKGNKLLAVGDGTADTDGVNLAQVRQFIRNLDWKQSVRVASQANVTIAAPGASIDGIALSVGDRVLLKAQTSGAENGIYDWQGSAVPMTRSADADANAEVTAGMVVIIEDGSNADQLWLLTTNNPITVGVTVLSFARLGGAPYATIVGDGVTQTIVVTHNLGTQDVQVTVFRNSGLFAEVQPEVRHTSANTVTLRFTPAPALNEFRVVIA